MIYSLPPLIYSADFFIYSRM